MMKNLRKYQLYYAFRHYQKKVSWETALKDKSKIEGAYLLLKRYKNRLKTYDVALEKLEHKKCDRSELTELALSVDKTRGYTIFNDMKLLFDTTVS